MSTNKKKKNASIAGPILSIIVAAVVTLLLLHPRWLPLSARTVSKIEELEQKYFLIGGNSQITFAHILTSLLVIVILWLFYAVMKLILTSNLTQKSARARTVSSRKRCDESSEISPRLMKRLSVV